MRLWSRDLPVPNLKPRNGAEMEIRAHSMQCFSLSFSFSYAADSEQFDERRAVWN